MPPHPLGILTPSRQRDLPRCYLQPQCWRALLRWVHIWQAQSQQRHSLPFVHSIPYASVHRSHHFNPITSPATCLAGRYSYTPLANYAAASPRHPYTLPTPGSPPLLSTTSVLEGSPLMGPHLAGAVVAAALAPLRLSTASHTLPSPTLTVSTPSLLPLLARWVGTHTPPRPTTPPHPLGIRTPSRQRNLPRCCLQPQCWRALL